MNSVCFANAKKSGRVPDFFVFFGTAYGPFLPVGETVVSPTAAVEVSAEHPSPLIARAQNEISVPARRGAVL